MKIPPEELSIGSIEEELAPLEEEFRRSAEYALERMSISIVGLPDALLIPSRHRSAGPIAGPSLLMRHRNDDNLSLTG